MHHTSLIGIYQKVGHMLYQVFCDVYEKEIGGPMIETVTATDCFVTVVVCADKYILYT